ncbi:ribosome recycling factor [Aureispira anguillae]|uniref:Ribosome-recycling factor n=1 Tax=Aureispira anguillae TaxID=2864201 RepID=A0A915YKF5_9BACT|nr:ribosome recycling factor [Aureispira anguillae]BDS14581.1 ribosome recycling factor [Aureispira anguillae]
MEEEIALYVETAEESMQGSIEHFKKEVSRIRSGKATPAMFDGVRVDYYGSQTPLAQVANIKAQDGRTLIIAPWEKSMLQAIEQAIFQANMGVTPQNDGEIIRIVLPMLTEERRKDLIKQAHVLVENAKVSIRNARRDVMNEIKKAVKDGYPEDAGKTKEAVVQDLTNKYSNVVEQLMKRKEEDIMTI